MALVEAGGSPKRSLDIVDDVEVPEAKRFRIEELPLKPEQRAIIDEIVLNIKKRGIYDQIRHQIFKDFKESVKSAFHIRHDGIRAD